MQIRKTKSDEIDILIRIYSAARKHMEESGNSNQWIKGYPGIELLQKDIKKGNSYVCLNLDRIVGTFSFIKGNDPTYLKIYRGKWLNDDFYGVIHRIAVVERKKGIASFCLDWCFDQLPNLRIDTHKDNKDMQSILFRKGFIYCGIIHTADGSERLAFQKTLS